MHLVHDNVQLHLVLREQCGLFRPINVEQQQCILLYSSTHDAVPSSTFRAAHPQMHSRVQDLGQRLAWWCAMRQHHRTRRYEPTADPRCAGRPWTSCTGEASAGKSQICMQMLLHVQLPPSLGGLAGSALYVLMVFYATHPHFITSAPPRYLYTEGTHAHRRLKHMAQAFTARYARSKQPLHNFSSNTLTRSFAHHLPPNHTCEDNILVECAIHSPGHLLEALHRVPQYLHRPGHLPLRLLVIDSVANVFRSGTDEADKGAYHYVDRAAALFQVCAVCKGYEYAQNNN